MAEAILPCVLEKLGSLVTPYITEEFKLQRGLTKELESIKNELEIITAFLRDAEEKANEGSDLVKTWVSQVRTVAYKIEDIIDQSILLTLTDIQRQPKNVCLSIPYKVVRCIMELKAKHDIGSSISDVKSEILLLQQRKLLYDLKMVEITSSNWVDPRVGVHSTDSDLVGIDDPKAEIFELLDFEVKDPRCSIISITGMGGIGKTTLARKVYDNAEAKRYFYVRAWVNVNKFYDRKNIFKGMLQEFYNIVTQPTPSGLGDMEEEALINEVKSFLNDKRYLLVFDDVWDLDLWHRIKHAFPDNGKGSKILMTTREVHVARTWTEPRALSHIYEAKLLSPDMSWDLFCKKAFLGEYKGQCPTWLEEISHNIVDRCEGLPLAIVTVSGLLSTKEKVYNEWKRFYDSLSSQLQRDRRMTNVSKILLLSYNNMPYYLKPCLVYFGVFPQGSSIEYNRLIKLWTAEDFIQRKRGIEIEDVANEYLSELMQRSLVHVSTWYDSGRARTFRVHDLIHEILWSKLEELNFCRILEEENAEFSIQSRRLSIQEQSLDEVSKSVSVYDKSNIRSILQFRAQEMSNTFLSSSILERLCLLKVLDLQSAPLDQIPKHIGDLLLLQYLSLRYTKVKSIPKSIGKLKNLLTLDLKRCPISELPREISNLRKLRHFVVYQNKWHDILKIWVIGAVKVPNGALAHLENLQKLADINVAESEGFLDQLSKFKKLKYLAISNVKAENSQALCKAIEILHSLESLNITVDYESTDPLDLQYVTRIPSQIQRLYLIGPLKQFPEWIGGLVNLNKLRFRGSKLDYIPFNVLQELPNLTMLGINKDVYYGEELVFQKGGFKKLKAIYFDALINLKSVEIQPDALPLLEDLLIHRSPKLKEIPFGLKYLKKLTSLKVVEMSDEFVQSIYALPHIVQHVADIRVGYQTPDGIYKYEKLSPNMRDVDIQV